MRIGFSLFLVTVILSILQSNGLVLIDSIPFMVLIGSGSTGKSKTESDKHSGIEGVIFS